MAKLAITFPGIKGAALDKPAWTLPNAAFPIVWSVNYVLMGMAAYYASAAGVGAAAMKMYGVQLALNLAWSPIFFLAKDLTLALAAMLGLDLVALRTGRAFAGVSDRAGALWAPYMAWLAYATALMASMWLRNPAARAGPWRGGRGFTGRARRAAA
jgi:tryptophan-rich sensory protein